MHQPVGWRAALYDGPSSRGCSRQPRASDDRVEDDLDELQAAYVVAHTPADGGAPPSGEQLRETVALLSTCHAKDIVRMRALRGRQRCVAVLRRVPAHAWADMLLKPKRLTYS